MPKVVLWKNRERLDRQTDKERERETERDGERAYICGLLNTNFVCVCIPSV